MHQKEGKTSRAATLSLVVYAVICVLPIVLTVSFYALRSNVDVMDRVVEDVSAPVQRGLGLFSSVFPFSLMEVVCAVAGTWLICHLIGTIVVTVRGSRKLKILARRIMTVAIASLYAWSAFCWLWNSGYHATGFAEKNGFVGGGATVEELAAVAFLFAEKANEFAPLINRDEDNHCIEDRRDFFDVSTQIYHQIAVEFPDLDGRLHQPKSMMFSWLMSRTGYTGVYFALTGESNINTRAPVFLMPATIAHELAHQRGVAAEDEASFVGILACTTSGFTSYEYAGYLMGLIYLRNALFYADRNAWDEINDSLCAELVTDLRDNYDFWQAQKTVETGNDFLDSILTALTGTVSDTVETIYDGYLKSQNQELGVRSYGACVDLLVEYFLPISAAPIAVANTAFGGMTNLKSVRLLNAD